MDNRGKRKFAMRFDVGTWMLILLAAAMMAVTATRGREPFMTGLEAGGRTLLQFAPLLIAIFITIGFAEVLIPRELFARWLGSGSGLRGILVGSALGFITPGGPYVSFPLAATLLETGASIGSLVAYITSWGLLSFSRIPMELAIVGPRVTLARLASCLLLPPLAGFIASLIFERAVG